MKKIIYISLCSLVIFIGLPTFVHAADMYMVLDKTQVSAQEIFSATVYVSSEGTAINNAEASINFPANLLSVSSVSTAGSIFSIWVEQPSFSNTSGTIRFNGGIPTPGYSGKFGNVVRINFIAKNTGTANITFGSSSVRANDGNGTDVLSGTRDGLVTIIEATPVVVPDTETEPDVVPDTEEVPETVSDTETAPEGVPGLIQEGPQIPPPQITPEPEYIQVVPKREIDTTVLIQTISNAITFIVLLAVLFVLIYYAIKKFRKLRRHLRKDRVNTEHRIDKVFEILNSDTKRHIKMLQKASAKRKLTKEEILILDELWDNLEESEKYFTNKVRNIKKKKDL